MKDILIELFNDKIDLYEANSRLEELFAAEFKRGFQEGRALGQEDMRQAVFKILDRELPKS